MRPDRQNAQTYSSLLQMRISLTTFSAWKEWKQLCALALCCAGTTAELSSFARLRFNRLMKNYFHGDVRPPCDPWHLFETHMTVKHTRAGKCYKDWLFARLEQSSDPEEAVLEGGASLIMRDVVREYLRNECAKAHTISLDQTLSDNIRSTTLVHLLASEQDTMNSVCLQEYQKLSVGHAEELVQELTDKERTALLAKHIGIALTHPLALQAAGCRKTALNKTYVQYVNKVAGKIQEKYHDDDKESQLTLTLMTMQTIKHLNYEREKTQNPQSALFMITEHMPTRNVTYHEAAATEIEACI